MVAPSSTAQHPTSNVHVYPVQYKSHGLFIMLQTSTFSCKGTHGIVSGEHGGHEHGGSGHGGNHSLAQVSLGLLQENASQQRVDQMDSMASGNESDGAVVRSTWGQWPRQVSSMAAWSPPGKSQGPMVSALLRQSGCVVRLILCRMSWRVSRHFAGESTLPYSSPSTTQSGDFRTPLLIPRQHMPNGKENVEMRAPMSVRIAELHWLTHATAHCALFPQHHRHVVFP